MIRSSDLTKSHYRPGEVAVLLRVSPETVARYDRAGRISFGRTPGGRRVISKENLLDYLKGRGLVQMEDSRVDMVYLLSRILDNQPVFQQTTCQIKGETGHVRQ